jgi:Fic family protein
MTVFGDANGRTSRLMMNYVLMENGLNPAKIATQSVNQFAILNSDFVTKSSNTQLVREVIQDIARGQ